MSKLAGISGGDFINFLLPDPYFALFDLATMIPIIRNPV